MGCRQKVVGWLFRIAALLSAFFLASGVGRSQQIVAHSAQAGWNYEIAISAQWNGR